MKNMKLPFRLPAVALALAIVSLAGSASATRLPPGEEARGDVLTYVEHGDCAGAVKRLNEGLGRSFPEVFLLAGSMYDQGICVKPDWQRAVHFYVRAHDGGQREAAYRLAAGFAAPEHGADAAAALWWAGQAQGGLVGSNCTVPADASNDPDRFVAELKTWPARQLSICNYSVGVLATLGGEVNYPRRALANAIAGEFTVVMTPALDRVEVQQGDITAVSLRGLQDGNFASDRVSKSVTGSFSDTLRGVAERAMKRYPKPEGLDPQWQLKMKYSFGLN